MAHGSWLVAHGERTKKIGHYDGQKYDGKKADGKEGSWLMVKPESTIREGAGRKRLMARSPWVKTRTEIPEL